MNGHFCLLLLSLLSLLSLLGCEPCPKPKSPPCDSPCVLRTVKASANPDNFFCGSDRMSVCDCSTSGTTMGSSDGLQGLSFSSGTLTPAFAPSITSYTLALASPSASLTVTATVGQPTTNLLINGSLVASGVPFGPLALSGSQPVIQILVTPAKQSTKAYTVNVQFESWGYLKDSSRGSGPGLGSSVSVDGTTVAVGVPSDASAIPMGGRVLVFVRSNARWVSQALLAGTMAATGDRFGSSVSISGNTLAVGAPGQAGSTGAVYVFQRSGTAWTLQAYLIASNGQPNDSFGVSVSLSGDTLAVGAPGEASSATGVNGNQADNSAPQSGAVYLFQRDIAGWRQQAYLKAHNTDGGDQFGGSVSLSGSSLAIGASGEASSAVGINGDGANNSAPSSGAVYVFQYNGSAWAQQAYVKASNSEAGDQFGGSVSLSGDSLAVGAIGEDSSATGLGGSQADNGASGSGAAYLFQSVGGVWAQQAYVKASNSRGQLSFGGSVSLSFGALAVGASQENSGATLANGDQSSQAAPGSGAVYWFLRSGTVWGQRGYLKAMNPDSGDAFGSSVALFDTTLCVGAPGEDSSDPNNPSSNSGLNSGAAYVLLWDGSRWGG